MSLGGKSAKCVTMFEKKGQYDVRRLENCL